jgi:hypothetical protein
VWGWEAQHWTRAQAKKEREDYKRPCEVKSMRKLEEGNTAKLVSFHAWFCFVADA